MRNMVESENGFVGQMGGKHFVAHNVIGCNNSNYPRHC